MTKIRARLVGMSFRPSDGYLEPPGPAVISNFRLNPDLKLDLVPDPTNVYDPNAIKVYMGSRFIGFVQKEAAQAVARRGGLASSVCGVAGFRIHPDHQGNPGIDLILEAK